MHPPRKVDEPWVRLADLFCILGHSFNVNLTDSVLWVVGGWPRTTHTWLDIARGLLVKLVRL